MRYIQKYKCRICGKIIKGGITGSKVIVTQDIISAIGLLPKQIPMGTTMNSIHTCENGSVGVTDFLGYEKEE